MKLKWKKLKNFKNVLDDRYKISNDGDVMDLLVPEIMHQKIANKKHHPYYAVYLKFKNGKSEWVLVHQLVAHCFVKIPKKYKGVKDLVPDHLDNNGLNNNYKNLEWKTRGENVSDAFKKGFVNYNGENSSSAIINNATAHKICKLLEKDKTYKEIIEELDLPDNKSIRQLLVRIKCRNAWTEISSQYKFDSSKNKYTEKQLFVINNIPKIQKLIAEGYNNMEIARMIWDSDCNIKSAAMTVANIRNKSIYQEFL